VRAGEKVRALATLDFGRLPGEFFREARALSDELWSERLARLERVSVIRARHGPAAAEGALVVTDDGLVGWREDNLRGGDYLVADLATGKVIRQTPQAFASAIFATRSAVFVEHGDSAHTCFSRIARDGRDTVENVQRGARQLADVDPAGTRLLVRDGSKAEIVAWPSLERVADMGSEWIVMDWENRVGLAPTPEGVLAVFESGEKKAIRAPHTRRSFFHLLAPGVYAWAGPSLVLLAWPRMKPIQLLGDGRDELPPLLSRPTAASCGSCSAGSRGASISTWRRARSSPRRPTPRSSRARTPRPATGTRMPTPSGATERTAAWSSSPPKTSFSSCPSASGRSPGPPTARGSSA
jgi:hypothetical protein